MLSNMHIREKALTPTKAKDERPGDKAGHEMEDLAERGPYGLLRGCWVSGSYNGSYKGVGIWVPTW